LRSGLDLSESAASEAAHALTSPDVAQDEKAEFLRLLHEKGESIAEVSAFAKVFRELASDPGLGELAHGAIDIVGTGGTGTMGYNISSVTAMIVAASGSARVLKHGNRAITSQSGSADFLGSLGVRMDTDPAALRAAAEQLNFCFFFAPAFHPAFKEIMPVRKAMAAAGQRSIFNILGPLINPARPDRQLLGVFAPQWVPQLAGVLDTLGLQSGMVVSCSLPDGKHMDEFTTAGLNCVQGVGSLRDLNTSATADHWGFAESSPAELRGGSAEDNLQLLKALMDGRGPAGLRETILLNAAAAFHILELDNDFRHGRERARDILCGGPLRDWLANARDFYASAS
jgi:anthranilate phosphoribosyltransferase